MQTIEGMNIKLGPYKRTECGKAVTFRRKRRTGGGNTSGTEIVDKACGCQRRAVRLGDVAVIDFAGYRNGQLFDGGSGTDYPLEIGSGAFIPGFEEQLVGAETGQQVDVNVTFPQDYGAPDLAGQDALFKVTVKKIQEYQYPEMTDEAESGYREKTDGTEGAGSGGAL